MVLCLCFICYPCIEIILKNAADPSVTTPSLPASHYTNHGRQGDRYWQQKRTGNPLRDFPYLQMSSFNSPEEFWPSILQELKISFKNPPSRFVFVDVLIMSQ